MPFHENVVARRIVSLVINTAMAIICRVHKCFRPHFLFAVIASWRHPLSAPPKTRLRSVCVLTAFIAFCLLNRSSLCLSFPYDALNPFFAWHLNVFLLIHFPLGSLSSYRRNPRFAGTYLAHPPVWRLICSNHHRLFKSPAAHSAHPVIFSLFFPSIFSFYRINRDWSNIEASSFISIYGCTPENLPCPDNICVCSPWVAVCRF